ncbi:MULTISPECIES: hypothetical protein [unclassified Mesorhizobium]|uniref:hypothetical protein n=1 Tax=unclassified Mesorhizobium TaxID=325217 RepID=UPI000FD93345|nr:MULTISPECIES: hypothetical protein [unclassified Mesorhizobium]TGT76743.1 hypothetical protein EN809_003835 [Mesorhizobium sp. M2E.F.Ca.ET.166.01.1.1]TGW02855.1 hypothetical protein EN797_003835 [Mesorhizobium sp. M2E.F.Ca.ET.154.01.1.1]
MNAETTDIIRDSRDDLRAALEVELAEADMKKLEKQARQIADEISEVVFYDIKENMAQWLADHVSSTASACIEAILAGNESEARRKLALKPEAYYDGRDFQPWFNHSSRLHESGPVELRRKIVEAHRDIITDARIADLEAQLELLVKKYYVMEHRDLPEARRLLREAEYELEQWRAADAAKAGGTAA